METLKETDGIKEKREYYLQRKRENRKKYVEANKELVNNKNKEYYNKNKESINQKRQLAYMQKKQLKNSLIEIDVKDLLYDI
jgi:hypothetical protein